MQKRVPWAVIVAFGLLAPAIDLTAQVILPLHAIPLLEALCFLIPAAALCRLYGLQGGFITKGLVKKLVLVFGASILVTLCLNALLYFWTQLLPPDPRYTSLITDILHADNRLGLVIDLLNLAVIPALCEELFFRGFLLTALRTRVSLRAAVAITAILFACVHMNPSYFIFYVFLGVYFALLFAKGRNLSLNILAHAVNNGLGVILYHYTRTVF